MLNKYAYYDKEQSQFYASDFWIQLVQVLDAEQSDVFKKEFENKVPLQIMVKYTQENFLRKKDQRWALENYNDFSEEKKGNLDSLLKNLNQFEEQKMPKQVEFALFLGGSTANLCKRAFYIYDSIVKCDVHIENVVVLGNTEPYDKFLSALHEVITVCPEYFLEKLTAKDVPIQATMHETMLFVLENLRWPEKKKPIFITLPQQHPCNTSQEASAVINYLETKLKKSEKLDNHKFFQFQDNKSTVLAVSNQPFNDRQGITILGEFNKNNMNEKFKITAAGSGTETYPLLNKLPASITNHTQIVDNLTRTLYEINANAKELLIPESSNTKNLNVSLVN